MAIDPKTLKTSLEKDIAEGQAIVQRSAAGRAAQPETIRRKDKRGFLPKALRVGGKIIGQAELQSFKGELSHSINRLMQTAQFRNAEEKRAAQTALEQKLNNVSLELLKKGQKFKLEQQKRLSDAGARIKSAQVLEGVISNATFAALRGIDFFGGEQAPGTLFEQESLEGLGTGLSRPGGPRLAR